MSTTAQIQEIYVGLLGRAADAEGLSYWTAEIDGGVLTIEQLRANIVNEQPEYAANLGSLTRTALVETLYENLFEREPDAEGLTYWTTGEGSSVNADQLVLALSNGASTADRAALDNKTEAATYYTNNAATYRASEAQAAVSAVDGTAATLTASKTATEALAINGVTVTLTAGADTPTLTANNDSIIGDINTLTSSDSIIDSSTADNDVLTLDMLADVDASTTVTNIETLKLSALAGTQTIDLTAIKGVDTIEHLGTGNLTARNIENADVAYKMTGTSTNLDVSVLATALTGAGDSARVTLDGVTAGTFTANGAVETVRVTSNGTAENVLTNIVSTSSTALVIDGNADFENTGAIATGIATIDARQLDGKADIDTAGATTVLTGAGDDKVDTDAALTASTLISMGAGTDTLELDASTGGATATLVGVEKITTKDAAATDIDLTNANQKVDVKIDAAATGVTVDNMKSGSTVVAAKALAAGAVTMSMNSSVKGEAFTLDLQKGGAIGANAVTFTNIADATLKIGATTTLSTFGDITGDETGSETLTKLTVVSDALAAVTGAAIVTADDVTDLTVTNTGAGLLTLTTYVDAEKLVNVDLNATSGAITIGAIGGTTASVALDTFEVNAGKNVTIAAVGSANALGVSSIELNATGGTITGGAFTNTGGNIESVVVTGSKDVSSDFTAATSGYVETVNAAALTGQLTTTITNVGTSGIGTNVILGSAVSGKTNSVTLASGRDDTVTGGSGADSVTISVQSSNTVNLGAGTDTLSFAGMATGKVINIGTASQYLAGKNATNAEAKHIVAAGKAYDITTASLVETAATGKVTTISNVENITGTGSADIIYGNTGANTITGGEGADTITVAAGNDTVVVTNGLTMDTVTDFVSGTDTIAFSLSGLRTANKVAAADTLDFVDAIGGAANSIAAGDTVSIAAIAGATNLDAVSGNILNYTAAAVADAAALEVALEGGGTGILTADGAIADDDAFLIMYDNGTNIMLAAVQLEAAVADNGTVDAVDVFDLVSLTGVTADLVAADFSFIA